MEPADEAVVLVGGREPKGLIGVRLHALEQRCLVDLARCRDAAADEPHDLGVAIELDEVVEVSVVDASKVQARGVEHERNGHEPSVRRVHATIRRNRSVAPFATLSTPEGWSIVVHRSEVPMTQHDENCPTCGSPLTALNRAELRRCNSCRRNNPAGFLYCGYCAAPMEHTEIRARLAEVAAPPGGWPNLAGDLTEVKFFLKQGQLDEAYDLLSILQRRYPGHPDLADFARSSEAAPPPDAEVENLVDTVLAESSTLGGKLPRRRATPWDAPSSDPIERRGRKLTNAHEVVRAALIEDVEEEDPETNPRAKVVVADYAKNPRPARKPVPKVDRTNAFAAIPPKRMPKVKLRKPKGEMPKPKLWRDSVAKARAVGEAAEKVKTAMKASEGLPPVPEPNYAEKGRPATVHMPPVRAEDAAPSIEIPLESAPKVSAEEATTEIKQATVPEKPPEDAIEQPVEEAKPAAAPQHTVAVDALQPPAPFEDDKGKAQPQHTMVVDALQPPAPFEGEAPVFEARKEQIKRATNRTGRRRRVTGSNKVIDKSKRKRPRGVPPRREEQEAEQDRKPRGTAFGAGVLSRFGR